MKSFKCKEKSYNHKPIPEIHKNSLKKFCKSKKVRVLRYMISYDMVYKSENLTL